jgi:hypothetical protein
MADEMQRALGFLGEIEQHAKIGVAGEDPIARPSLRLSVADEIRREHAPIGLQLPDQRQPLLMGGATAMTDDDGWTFARVEIGDVESG